MDRLSDAGLKRIGVAYEDDAVAVVNKPAGLAVHGGAGAGRSLIEVLQAALPKASLHLAHRIDRETSGAVLVAKSDEVARRLQAAWPDAEKVYLAWVFGIPAKAIEIRRKLEERDGTVRKARTLVQRTVLARPKGMPDLSVVAAELQTGRRHQIRRHLAMEGYPLVMDDKYGDFALNRALKLGLRKREGPKVKSLMLHSFRLTLPEAVLPGKPLSVEVPPPDSWRVLADFFSIGLPVLEH